jgi:thiamine transport system ATP-binding protein
VLRVVDAVVRLEGRSVVDGVELSVESGETLAVLGPSGSGKTTLLRAIAGLQPLERGRIEWDGVDLVRTPPHERRFGMMFQEYALFPHRDVQGNVEFGLRMAGLAPSARRRRVEEILTLVGLADLRARPVATLSGGEQQRVALARALAVAPRLLMLDEPLGALDRAWRTRLVDDIRALLERARLPALYVTHDHDEAFTVAARVVVMRAGRIVQQGTPAAVWRHPADAWIAQFLGFGPPTPCRVVRSGSVLETPWGELVAPDHTPDGPAEVVFRPDALRLDAGGPIHGVVTRTTFAGPVVLCTVTPSGGGALPVRVAQRDAPSVGARVALAVDPAAVLLYRQNGD